MSTTESTGGARLDTCRAVVASVALVACFSLPALAEVDPPQPERVWGGCELGSNTLSVDTVQALIGDMTASGLTATTEPLEVAFVVIYSFKNNDGQGEVTLGPATGFTGPILCINPDEVETPNEVTESADIPTQTGPSGATSIDILDLEEAMILRYEINDGSADGDIEKRFCHTTGVNNDCFRIFPLPTAP